MTYCNARSLRTAAPAQKLAEEMAVQFRDYYETLGVSKSASDDDIRSAFRKLALHPRAELGLVR